MTAPSVDTCTYFSLVALQYECVVEMINPSEYIILSQVHMSGYLSGSGYVVPRSPTILQSES